MIIEDNGTWSRKGDLVSFTPLICRNRYDIANYNKRSIEQVLNHVRNTPGQYGTDEAWKKDIVHLEHGLSLFV